MKNAVLVIAVLMLCSVARAATVTAANCTQSSVQTAITSAGRNGTVNVPAGNCTWHLFPITAGVTLLGNGAGSTVITLGSGGTVGCDGNSLGNRQTIVCVEPDATAIANDETIKISGFTFDGAGFGYGLLWAYGAPDTGTKPFKNLIINNNTFKNTGSSSGGGNTCIYTSDEIRGVIYSNVFDGCDIVLRPIGSDTTTEWANTAYNQFSYGSSDNLFFESNTIQYSTAYNSIDNYGGWIESGQGGRVVVRFNTWNMANITNQGELWDIHGFQNWPGGETGTMLVEYYGNTVTNGTASTYRWINHRGSWGMFFNNTYTGASNPEIDIDQYNGGCTNQIVPTPTNYNPIVNNTYFFTNLVNNTLTDAIAGSVNDCGTKENVNWWNQQVPFVGTTGVGVGLLSARPATCTTGVGYWATDQGSWNLSGSGGQGVFYKCTAANTWTLYYTPYVFPHPLRGGTAPPNAPTGLNAIVH